MRILNALKQVRLVAEILSSFLYRLYSVQFAVWLVFWLVSWLVGWLVGWFVIWLVDWLVSK